MKEIIFLSPSNQYANVGCYKTIGKSLGIASERDYARYVANLCAEYLEKTYDCEVHVAVDGDNMTTRLKKARELGATCYLPIHTNAGGGKGVDAFYTSGDEETIRFAKLLYNNFYAIAGIKHGCKAAAWQELRDATWCTHSYLEIDYHDNEERTKWLINNTDLIAKTIGDSIAEIRNLTNISLLKKDFQLEEEKTEPVTEEIKMEKYCVAAIFDTKEEAQKVADALAVLGSEFTVLPVDLEDDPEEPVEDEELEVENPVILDESTLTKPVETPKEEIVEAEPIKVGDKVKLDPNATVYGSDKKFASYIYSKTLYVRQINGDRVVISTVASGAVTGAVDIKYLILVK